MAAIDDLNALLAGLPNASLITEPMKNTALAGALVPDIDGVWPGQAEYVPTHDVYFAAMNLIGFLQAQPVVRQSSSEGTSIAVDAPDWSALVAYYRSMSPICSATGNGVLQRVLIPEGPHVRKLDMSYGGDEYGNVDTDLG
jgi:hypothetical protein